jgi:glycosyltransferase involved in cell wall biosynthesis
MSTPRVSVVIPTFNRARLVSLTIESVLAQDFRDLEIIVIDDGSTDDTPAALARFGDRIRSVRQENRGMNAARNTALAGVRGEFVALLDSDDLWETWKLGVQVALLDRFPEAGFVFSDFCILYDSQGVNGPRRAHGLTTWDEGANVDSPYSRRHSLAGLLVADALARLPAGDFTVQEGDVYELSLYQPTVLPSTALIRMEALQGLRLPENDNTCGDWDFFARLSHRAGALYLDADTTINRSHEDAVRLTRVDSRLQLQRRIAMIDRLWRADGSFMVRNGAHVDEVQRRLLASLARLHLLGGDSAAAREALARADRLGRARSAGEWATRACAHLPGGGPALRTARSAAHAMRRLLSGGSPQR